MKRVQNKQNLQTGPEDVSSRQRVHFDLEGLLPSLPATAERGQQNTLQKRTRHLDL